MALQGAQILCPCPVTQLKMSWLCSQAQLLSVFKSRQQAALGEAAKPSPGAGTQCQS